ncbi:MAG TPA: TrbI/VirB10 family protein [Verrucomicrobiae bacterium]|nr:TrbI/VirB10 family protein [Verrucomicrobiae bacterium]
MRRVAMHGLLTLLLVSAMAWGQTAEPSKPAPSTPGGQETTATPTNGASQNAPTAAVPAGDPNAWVIPAGSKIPLTLKQAISTKNAREGDAVYAETVFPLVMNNHIVVPAGTYIQGKIMRVEHPGHGKKRAELLIHFTSMIYPTGYTVMLPGSVENTPGADDKGVKDQEGTIQQDKDTGKRVEDAARDAAVAGTVGSIGGLAAGGLNGARYGGLAGLAGGVAWALLKHGPDVKLEVGTSIEMEIQRDVPVDGSRIQVANAGSTPQS